MAPEHRPETVITRPPPLCLWGFVSLLLHHLLTDSAVYLFVILLLTACLPPKRRVQGRAPCCSVGYQPLRTAGCHLSGVLTGVPPTSCFRACGFLPGGEGFVLNPSPAWALANRRQTCLPASPTGSGSRTLEGWEAPAWVLPGTRQVRATPRYACAVFTTYYSMNYLKQILNSKPISPAPSTTVRFFSCGSVVFPQECT